MKKQEVEKSKVEEPTATPVVAPATALSSAEGIVTGKPEVTEEQKLNFFKAFLADKPYEEVMSLFDGKFEVIFRTMTSDQNSDVFKQIALDTKNPNVDTSNDTYMVTVACYRLCQTLVAINGEPFVLSESSPDDANSTYVKATAERMKQWQIYKLSALLDAFREFEGRVMVLTREALNKDFWKAAK